VAVYAAATKHTVIRVKKTIGKMKKYLQLKIVTATKQRASAHAVGRMRPKVSAEKPPSCHASTAANRRNTETKSPAPTKRSQ
jgi:hypothetical protein